MTPSWRHSRPSRARNACAATALLAVLVSSALSAHAAATALTCTNPASGASWQIHVDFDKSTVDAYPATITGAKIVWHDAADGGSYALDRHSGALTEIVASSTGGYFLHDQCAMKK